MPPGVEHPSSAARVVAASWPITVSMPPGVEHKHLADGCSNRIIATDHRLDASGR